MREAPEMGKTGEICANLHERGPLSSSDSPPAQGAVSVPSGLFRGVPC